MRLFVAVNLTEPCQKALATVQRDLLARASAGRAVPAAQLHLTLAFIGESDRPDEAAACLERLPGGTVPLELRGVGRGAPGTRGEGAPMTRGGRFGRGGGALVWAGLTPCPALDALAAEVRRRLAASGFAVDPKPFRPHLTLARRVVLRHEADWAAFENAWPADRPLCAMEARRVCLMESTRVDGRLVYNELAAGAL